jgi:protein-disulfide isomerase
MKAARWSAKLIMPVMPGRDHIRGLSSAAVTLLQYGDYDCPNCRAAHGIVTTIQAQLRNRLCYVYRHFPLATAHPHAQEAAEAAEAAGNQNKFWEMHDTLLSVAAPLSSNLLRGAAVSLGLNVPLFAYELSQHVHLPRIREDFISGVRSGVNCTPTFYINEVRYDGEWDLTSVASAVNSAALTSSAVGA